ncbi:MAG: hypothetical protein HQP61_03415 [Peptococcaceae bacterium]|nr:hypothetical protein [Candidatus Syntrophopropionicum ammoniitolerans]
MGRKKQNKRGRVEESAGTVLDDIPKKGRPSGQKDFSQLSPEWRKLYKLITRHLNKR